MINDNTQTVAHLGLFSVVDGAQCSYNILSLIFIYSAASGLSCGMPDLHFTMRDLLLRRTDSLVAVHRHSCSEAYGILVFQPGIEPRSPLGTFARWILAWQGVFLTTGPPEKSLLSTFLHLNQNCFEYDQLTKKT